MAKRVTVVEFLGDDALRPVIGAIAEACCEIAQKIRTAGLSDIYGAAGAVNVQGEQQQKLDVFANEAMLQVLRKTPSVAAAVSEEDDEPVVFEREGAEWVAIFDPLDGSSNIDVNVNVGTIVSIQRVGAGGDVNAAALQGGTKQAAALYVVYGPSTVMVLALPGRDGVASFVLDAQNEFVLSRDGLKMPEQGPYYSVNEANASTWPAAYREYVGMLVRGELGGKAYGARYIGSLVADFHRTLLKGGVFLYPPTEKAPKGKLRLLYEANPLALIAEQAGGAAVNGRERILEVRAEGVHERTPLVIGSRREVEALREMVAGAAR
jgi:fructose-1,6-bisphosphatase I